jgi:hypothetical protein
MRNGSNRPARNRETVWGLLEADVYKGGEAIGPLSAARIFSLSFFSF